MEFPDPEERLEAAKVLSAHILARTVEAKGAALDATVETIDGVEVTDSVDVTLIDEQTLLLQELRDLNQLIAQTLIDSASAAAEAERRGKRAEEQASEATAARNRQTDGLTVLALGLTGATIPTEPLQRLELAAAFAALAMLWLFVQRARGRHQS